MNYVRICKYCDKKDINDEWTSYCDIGKNFHNLTLTREEYERVEKQYLFCVKEIFELSQQGFLRIESLEKYKRVGWKNNQLIGLNDIIKFVRDCLRDRCWGRLAGENFYIHIGYDFYVYIGTNLDIEIVKSLVNKYHLFFKEMISPYLHNDN